jgi:hypothetical protein
MRDDDFFDSLMGAREEAKSPRKKPSKSKRSKPQADLFAERATESQVAKAKGKNMVAGRVPKSIRLPPALLEAIDAEARGEPGHQPLGAASGCGVFDMYELLIAYGWEAYCNGDIPITVTDEVRVTKKITLGR